MAGGNAPGAHLSVRKLLFRADTLQDAAISGAVAICIPFELAPLLVGRWELANENRNIIMLDDAKYFWAERPTPKQLELIVPLAKFPRYIPFILPPGVEFNENLRNKKITPESSALSSLIAVTQIILSVVQLYNKYDPSVATQGLSSPYLIVIPYFLMSFVNLLANVFVGSYRRVTMLRKKTPFPDKFNETYIVNCTRVECKKKNKSERHQIVLKIREQTPTGSPSTPSGEPKEPETTVSQVDGSGGATTLFDGLSPCQKI